MGSYLGNQEDQNNLSAASQTREIQVWEKNKEWVDFLPLPTEFCQLQGLTGGSDSVIQNMHMVYGLWLSKGRE
jgi:hypothetical protein